LNGEQEWHHIVEHLYSATCLPAKAGSLQVLSAFGGYGLSASIPARLSNKALFIFYHSVDYALAFKGIIFHFSPNPIKKHGFG
jgi:hypothetical protein